MRDLFLAPLLLAILFQTFRTPSIGVLGWTWLTLMTPQKLIWGVLSSMPLNLILALATLGMVLFTRDKKRLPANITITLWMLFIAMMTFTTITALNPSISWVIWNRVVKVMLLGLLVPVLMVSQRRIHALIWVIAMCLGYFGIKGGIFTLTIGGGGGHVVGPPDSQLIDNNNLALALCMSLPLMNYLRLQASTRFVRNGMLAGMIGTTFGALGTFSRGGMVGLGVMALYLWWKSPRKVSLALGILAVVIPAYMFMPASWYDRMGTLKDASNQGTFLQRLDSWTVNTNIAIARPFTGAGFSATDDPNTYRRYAYGKSIFTDQDGQTGGHAAHSIYFETLGDHGFVGCGLYFAMLLSALGVLRRVRKAAKNIPDLAWADNLVNMMQVSFLAFFVSGIALSMAYYDLVFLFIGIALALDKIVKEYKNKPAETGKPTKIAAPSGKWRAPAHAV
ncbi:MAG TPA: putative O-glycosylation ligase, exosortase A system-associated [Rhizomicrobium sp.]|nr:putative O-glycosylation ligase, exosortase A system-associated [Rhizomicrobium sp.]